MNDDANGRTWFAGDNLNRAADPAYVAEWWELSMKASYWWSLADVTPIDATLVLCGINQFNPEYRGIEHAEQTSFINLPADAPPAETLDGKERRREAFTKMRKLFESVHRHDAASRTMTEWLQIARVREFAYDRWVDDWLQARASLAPPEGEPVWATDRPQQQTDTPSNHVSQRETEVMPERNGRVMLKRGRNERPVMEAYIEERSTEIARENSSLRMLAIAMQIETELSSNGYEGDRGPMTAANIRRAMPEGITGGRARNGRKLNRRADSK
jgi:hypothetical protein